MLLKSLESVNKDDNTNIMNDNKDSYNKHCLTINLINDLCQLRLIAYNDFSKSCHLMFDFFWFPILTL